MGLFEPDSNLTGLAFLFTSLTVLIHIIKPSWTGGHTLALVDIEAREALLANSFQFSFKFVEDTKLIGWDQLGCFRLRDGDSIQTAELQFVRKVDWFAQIIILTQLLTFPFILIVKWLEYVVNYHMVGELLFIILSFIAGAASLLAYFTLCLIKVLPFWAIHLLLMASPFRQLALGIALSANYTRIFK